MTKINVTILLLLSALFVSLVHIFHLDTAAALGFASITSFIAIFFISKQKIKVFLSNKVNTIKARINDCYNKKDSANDMLLKLLKNSKKAEKDIGKIFQENEQEVTYIKNNYKTNIDKKQSQIGKSLMANMNNMKQNYNEKTRKFILDSTIDNVKQKLKSQNKQLDKKQLKSILDKICNKI